MQQYKTDASHGRSGTAQLALRRMVQDCVARNAFDKAARWFVQHPMWQEQVFDPEACIYMALPWLYGLVPPPDLNLITCLQNWSPALPGADYALGILYADGYRVAGNVYLAGFHFRRAQQTEQALLHRPSCWSVFSDLAPEAVVQAAENGVYASKFLIAAKAKHRA